MTPILPCQQLGVDLTSFLKGWGRSRGRGKVGVAGDNNP